jgi:hypothetical protein
MSDLPSAQRIIGQDGWTYVSVDGETWVLKSQAQEARAERDRLRNVLAQIAEMDCTCSGYYRCNSCPRDIATVAEVALETSS